MATYQRSVTVDAPLDAVWAFHSRIDGLLALTPGWLNLEVEAVYGPGGEPTEGALEAGSTIHASVRPFGIGPRHRWTSEIVAREVGDAHATFRDVMHDGPFPRWEHTHRFLDVDGRTRVLDTVEYVLPGGPLGRLVAPLSVIGFAPMFRYRHRRTRALLEE